MKKSVATLMVGIFLVSSGPAFAETSDAKRNPPQQDGPLLRASLCPNIVVDERATPKRGSQAPAAQTDQRSWVERHPVWTGAIAGFAAGYALTYLSGDEGGIIGRGSAALFYGGVSAGIGALVGWGVSRNQDDD